MREREVVQDVRERVETVVILIETPWMFLAMLRAVKPCEPFCFWGEQHLVTIYCLLQAPAQISNRRLVSLLFGDECSDCTGLLELVFGVIS